MVCRLNNAVDVFVFGPPKSAPCIRPSPFPVQGHQGEAMTGLLLEADGAAKIDVGQISAAEIRTF